MSLKKTFIIKEALPPSPGRMDPKPEYEREPGARPGTTRVAKPKKVSGYSVPLDKERMTKMSRADVTAEHLVAASRALSILGVDGVSDGRKDENIVKYLGQGLGDTLVQLSDGNFVVVTDDYYNPGATIISKEQMQQMKDAPTRIGYGGGGNR